MPNSFILNKKVFNSETLNKLIANENSANPTDMWRKL